MTGKSTHSSSTRRFCYLGIAAIGVMMVAVSTFAEFIGTDIHSFDLRSYLARSIHSPSWWRLFAAPLLTGAFFLVIAAIVPRCTKKVADLPILLAGTLVSGVLAFLGRGVALGAVVAFLILLAGELFEMYRRQQKTDYIGQSRE